MKKQASNKKKRKGMAIFLSRCLISILLVLSLAVLGMPQTINAAAETIENKKQIDLIKEEPVKEYEPEFQTDSLTPNEKEERYIEFEDINRRTETEKHYYMSDGTFMSETYAVPIHYKDDSGKLQDINNSLMEFAENGERKVKNASNSFSAEFAVDLSNDKPLVSLGKGKYKLDLYLDTEFEENKKKDSMLLETALDKEGLLNKTEIIGTEISNEGSLRKEIIAQAEISKADKYVEKEMIKYKDKKLTEGIKNENLKSELKFKNAISGTDFQYIVEQNAVKENIIVNQKKDKYEYRFILKVECVYLYLCSGGNIQATNESGEIIYEIPAPFMFDASEQYSDAVEYTLKNLDGYKYELIVIADEEWINAGVRTFPVTIDPTFVLPYNTTNFEVTRVNDENKTYTGNSNWYVRHNIFGESISRLVVRYRSPLSGKTLIASELEFEMKKTENGGKEVAGYFLDVSYIFNPTWALTNNNRDECIFIEKATGSWKKHSILVSGNYGIRDIVFKFVTEDTLLINEASFQNFKVREYYYISAKTRQNINFENEMFNLAFDVKNHEASLVIPYYIQEAPLMPISVYGIYMPGFSALRQAYIPDSSDFYGVNWKLNVEQYMIGTLLPDGKMFYTYIDESGNPIMLVTQEDNYYVSGNGLAYNPSDGWLGKKGNRQMYHFNSKGQLDQMQNADGQYFKIMYNSNGSINKLESYTMKSDSGSYYSTANVVFNYSNYFLKSLIATGLGTQTVSEFQYSNNLLTNACIEKKDVKISYSSDKILTVLNHDGYGYVLTYLDGHTDVNDYHNESNYARITKENMTVDYFQNYNRMYTTSYVNVIESNKNFFKYEAIEYPTYNGISPPKYFTKTESINNGENVTATTCSIKNGDIQNDLSWVNNSVVISAANISNYSNPVLIAKFKNVSNATKIVFRYGQSASGCSGGTLKDAAVHKMNGIAFLIVPLISITTPLELYCDFSEKIEYLGIGQLESQNIVETTQSGAVTLSDITKTDKAITNINEFGQINEKTITKSNGETYSYGYTYITNKNHLLKSIAEKQNGDLTSFKSYSYQSDNTNDKKARGLVTEIRTAYFTPTTAAFTEEIEYDMYGNVKKYKDQYNEYNYVFGFRGAANLQMTQSDVNGQEKVTYNYNGYGRLTGMANAAGTTSVAQNTRNNQYGFGSLSYDYNYTNNGDISEIKRNSTNVISYSYDNADNLRNKTFANGQYMSYTYDTYGNIKTKNSYYLFDGGTLVEDFYMKDKIDFSYSYNIDGNLESVAYDEYIKTFTYPDRAKNTLESKVAIKRPQEVLLGELISARNFTISTKYNKQTELYESTTYNIEGLSSIHTLSYKNELKGIVGSETNAYIGSGYEQGKSYDSFVSSYEYSVDGSLKSNQVDLKQTVHNSPSEISPKASYNRIYQIESGKNRTDHVKDTFTSSNYFDILTTDVSYTEAGQIGNLTRKSASGTEKNNVTYTYDAAGRILSEINTAYGIKFEYTYDSNNNIKTATEYRNGVKYNTETYIYNNGDDRLSRITNSNGTDKNFSYDALGNATKYNNENLGWTRGRLLSSIYEDGDDWRYPGKSTGFKYDENGIRYEKSYNNHNGDTSGKSIYYVEGSRIIGEAREIAGSTITYTNPLTGQTHKIQMPSSTTMIHYYYDQTGIIGMRYDDTDYLYIKDALGSITEVVDSAGNICAEYVYDAWGKIIHKSGTMADKNPFRYRGYYMDVETGWYYLQTRYYDPSIRRFINADNYELIPQLAQNIGELNLYSYCNNNPVMYTDSTGQFIDYLFDAVFIVWGIYEFAKDPSWDKGLWLALDVALAVVPFVPALSAARHLGKIDNLMDAASALNKIDNGLDLMKAYGHIDNFADAGGAIRFANRADFTNDAWNIAQGLDRTSGFTKSTATIGTKIHRGFMGGGRIINAANRVDGISDASRIIFELKPHNLRSIKTGIKQLNRYNDAMGGFYRMVLVLY